MSYIVHIPTGSPGFRKDVTPFIRTPGGEVKDKVGLSRTAIYKLIAAGAFPRQISIGPRTVAWSQDDLEVWIEERLNGHGPA